MDDEGAAPAQDRTAGLIGFGILLILTGALSLVVAALGVAATLLLSRFQSGDDSTDSLSAALPSIVFLVVTAGYLMVVGVGSIRTRRWARSLALATAWVWLLTGAWALAEVAYLVPYFLQHGGPAARMRAFMIVLVTLLVIVVVVLPAVMVAFYGGRHVRTTCERRDQTSPWTDRCPTPLLVQFLLLAYAVAVVLQHPGTYGAYPLFGEWYGGWAGYAMAATLALVLVALALALARRSWAGWWGTWVATALLAASSIVGSLAGTAPHPGGMAPGIVAGDEMYLVMPRTLFDGERGAWLAGAVGLAALAYLHFLRRYLPAPARPRQDEGGAAPHPL